ncbi:MAG: 4Fe-4S binding protein [Promethearchaeota archaeon]
MNKLNSESILEFLDNLGVELVGIAPIEPLLTDKRYKDNIKRICPNAKCVIVIGTVFPQAVLDACPENPRPARYTLHALYAEGETFCLKIARLLERHGNRAVIIPAYLPVEMSYETLGFKGDLNLKHAAVEAGLGSRGKSDLLITKNYGPRVRLFGVITDADLKLTPKSEEDFCTNCNICIKMCPSGALSEAGCDQKKCSQFAMKNGLPSILKFIGDLEQTKNLKKIFKKLRGLETWNYWQALSQGSFYECFMCIQSCPVGKKKFR